MDMAMKLALALALASTLAVPLTFWHIQRSVGMLISGPLSSRFITSFFSLSLLHESGRLFLEVA